MRTLKPLTLVVAVSVACAALTGCGDADPGYVPPETVSEGEEAALDEAASMLDAQRLPEGALPDVDPPAPEAAPEPTEPATR